MTCCPISLSSSVLWLSLSVLFIYLFIHSSWTCTLSVDVCVPLTLWPYTVAATATSSESRRRQSPVARHTWRPCAPSGSGTTKPGLAAHHLPLSQAVLLLTPPLRLILLPVVVVVVVEVHRMYTSHAPAVDKSFTPTPDNTKSFNTDTPRVKMSVSKLTTDKKIPRATPAVNPSERSVNNSSSRDLIV